MKVAIIGCGSIGLSFAEKLLANNFKSFKVFGKNNKYSASRAAGAMLNINSEIDCFNAGSEITKWKLKNRDFALAEWDKISTRLNGLGVTEHSLMFGKGTEIVLQGDSNKIECKSFQSMYDSVFNDNKSSEKTTFLIKDEQSVDSNQYLNALYSLVASNSAHVDSNIERVIHGDDCYSLVTLEGEIYTGFTHVFIMAGSWSQEILNNSDQFKSAVKRKSYYGVGSALLVKSELPYVEQPNIDRIVRTPNRGGTCGIHSVQRQSGLYVGASSVVTNMQLKSPRMSSVEALIHGSREVLGLDLYQLSCDVITGYRPVIDDGIPIIGEINKNLFCLFGTKRDGFTWAPAYAQLVYDYYFNDKKSECFNELISLTNPLREYTSCGKIDECIESYVNNKIYESFQHGVELNDGQIANLGTIARKVHESVQTTFKRDIGLQPELINMLYYVEGYGREL